MLLKIADFVFDIVNTYERIPVAFKNYVINNVESDYIFELSNDDIKYEERISDDAIKLLNIKNKSTYRSSAVYRKIAEWLPSWDAFVLHSACFDVDGVGVAFAAHSGTGKTTHMNRWMEYLGDRMTIVNGDKPIVRFFDNNSLPLTREVPRNEAEGENASPSTARKGEPNMPYAYGTPWNGKESLGCNMRTRLTHICFIERAETNYVESVDKSAVIERIFNQVYMPQNDPMAVVKTMELIDRLLSTCKLWVIHCNMDENAGEIAYKTIFENQAP